MLLFRNSVRSGLSIGVLNPKGGVAAADSGRAAGARRSRFPLPAYESCGHTRGPADIRPKNRRHSNVTVLEFAVRRACRAGHTEIDCNGFRKSCRGLLRNFGLQAVDSVVPILLCRDIVPCVDRHRQLRSNSIDDPDVHACPMPNRKVLARTCEKDGVAERLRRTIRLAPVRGEKPDQRIRRNRRMHLQPHLFHPATLHQTHIRRRGKRRQFPGSHQGYHEQGGPGYARLCVLD